LRGNKILSDIVVHNKYAKFNGTRRETWGEIAMRSAEMHAKKYPELSKEIWNVFGSQVFSKKVVPSMRSLQFAGKPIDLSPNRLYNCAFVAMDDYRAFSETMFNLLGGSGQGYSVQKRHTEQLPRIIKPQGTIRYVVQDSITGWADAIKFCLKAFYTGGGLPVYDFSDIREKGALLVTSGGKAPGPEPLKEAIRKIMKIMEAKEYGEQLRPIEVFDIQCYIAESVLAGGIRRSATIAIFDKNDEEMLTAKTGEWWIENPQRAMANISAVLHRGDTTREEFARIFRRTRASGSGEPGFIWSWDLDMGVNPCAEISIQSKGFCNLTEVNGSNVETMSDLVQRVKSASFIGTLQAGYTDFFYLRPAWKRNAEEDALLGVSITGIASLTWVTSDDLQRLGAIAQEENRRVAKLIGINPAKRVTCVKPSGTTSLVLGSSSGIHAWYSPYYIRRMRITKADALYPFLAEKMPDFLEDDVMRPHDTAVLSIPMKAPEDAVFRSESALDTFARVLKYAKNWVAGGHVEGLNKHNVSCTINVKDDEWDTLEEPLYEERFDYTGISLLPYDNGTYQQAPFETISEAKYNVMERALPDLDLTEVKEETDETDLSGEVACGGGGCEIR
jgi:ribonucleoside-triphosphate reductase